MLHQRTPMNRGKGFKRPVYVPPPAPPARALLRKPNYSGTTAPAAKPTAWRNRALLDSARDQPCLLRVAGICIGGTETTVACHSNLAIHGKAGARKADDAYSVCGCAACHRWLDQGYAAAGEKMAVFMAAHMNQVLEWRRRSADTSEPLRFRRAFLAVLEFLNATPLGEDHAST